MTSKSATDNRVVYQVAVYLTHHPVSDDDIKPSSHASQLIRRSALVFVLFLQIANRLKQDFLKRT